MKKILYICSLLTAFVLYTSCTSDIEATQEKGYLKLEVNTLASTYTRATNKPTDYNASTIYLEVVNSSNEVVASTNDFNNDDNIKGQSIALEPGTYTINAHSAGWDGSGSGMDAPFYAGSKSVTIAAGTLSTANVTLTQTNVKVSVIWDESISDNFEAATSTVLSEINGVNPAVFIMGQDNGSAFFPVSDLTLTLDVVNKSGEAFQQENTFNDLSARDHLIVTYKLADAGKEGSVNVFIDETTHTYEWTIQIPRKSSISLQANKVNAWSNFAEVSCVTSGISNTSNITLQYKKETDADWTEIAGSQLTATAVGCSYKLTSLTPATNYTYRFIYSNETTTLESNEVNFTTETQTAIYNGGFENWYSEGKIDYCGIQTDGKYWNSSNGGAANYVGSVTKQDTDFKHSGNSSARLGSKWAVVKLAAASLFTGDFIGLIGTKGAKLDLSLHVLQR